MPFTCYWVTKPDTHEQSWVLSTLCNTFIHGSMCNFKANIHMYICSLFLHILPLSFSPILSFFISVVSHFPHYYNILLSSLLILFCPLSLASLPSLPREHVDVHVLYMYIDVHNYTCDHVCHYNFCTLYVPIDTIHVHLWIYIYSFGLLLKPGLD